MEKDTMEINVTQKKRVNICRWFVDNNITLIVIGVALGIVCVISLYYWTSYHSVNLLPVSQSYQEVSNYIVTGKQSDLVIVEQFIDNNNNIYGVLAALQLANHLIKQNDFAKAEQKLEKIQSKTKDKNLLVQINLCLARVQLQEKKYNNALKTLNKIKDASWSGLVQNTYGDVLLATGDIQGARNAYSQGFESHSYRPLKIVLHIKLNDLSN